MANKKTQIANTEGEGPAMSSTPVSQHEMLRGRRLLTMEQMAKNLQVQQPYGDNGILLGPFELPSDDATKHIAIVGAPGSGKTVLMLAMMQAVLPHVGEPWKSWMTRDKALASIAQSNAASAAAAQPPSSYVSRSPRKIEAARKRWRAVNVALGVSTLLSFAIPPLWLATIVLAAVSYSRYRGYRAAQIGTLVATSPPTNDPSKEPEPAYAGLWEWDMHRALVYDAKLEILPQLKGMRRMRATIHVLNPFDTRSTAWDMAADITEVATAKQIAAIFIPEEKNASQPYFSDASRQLLEGVFVAFILTRAGKWTFRDVLNATKSRSTLIGVLGSSPVTEHLVETYLGNERESKSVLATLATKLGPYDVVAALWHQTKQKISLKDWLESESILVLANDEAYRSSLDVINQVIFKRIVELLLAKDATSSGRTWFFLDEVKEAGNLDALGRLMTKGRFVGAAVVLGLQDVEGFYDTFGENKAKSILGQCATKVFLRLDSTETAKWAESVFGEYEAIEMKQSATLGESTTDGKTDTKGTGRSSTSTEGTSRSGLGLNATHGSNSSTSETFSTNESTATSSTVGENKSLSKSAEIAKRQAILASEFMNLPMTSFSGGLHGFIAHHSGAARFNDVNFRTFLNKKDPAVKRVDYRGPDAQILQPWSDSEREDFVPGSSIPPAPPAPGAPGAANPPPGAGANPSTAGQGSNPPAPSPSNAPTPPAPSATQAPPRPPRRPKAKSTPHNATSASPQPPSKTPASGTPSPKAAQQKFHGSVLPGSNAAKGITRNK